MATKGHHLDKLSGVCLKYCIPYFKVIDLSDLRRRFTKVFIKYGHAQTFIPLSHRKSTCNLVSLSLVVLEEKKLKILNLKH